MILKIGSSTLTTGSDRISRGKIEDIARQLIQLKETHHVALVSSGAIATARHFASVNQWPNLPSRQALSAIGQPILMQIYHEIFRDFGIASAQCLLTYRDFDNQEAQNNIKNTLNELFENRFIPIINENDTVAVDEIVFGDNDKLSAYVAQLMDADLLLLASDINGLYDKNPQKHPDAKLIPSINDVRLCQQYIDENTDNVLGTGGMTSKIQAAEVCAKGQTDMWIVNGGNNNFVIDALNNNTPHTRFNFQDFK